MAIASPKVLACQLSSTFAGRDTMMELAPPHLDNIAQLDTITAWIRLFFVGFFQP
jgi:hypothetical protein